MGTRCNTSKMERMACFLFFAAKIILKLFFLPSLLSFATSTPVTLYYVVILHGFHTLILVSVLSCGLYFNLQEQKIGLLFLLCFHILLLQLCTNQYL